MSKYKLIKMSIKDQDSLISALGDMGYTQANGKLEVAPGQSNTLGMYGYHGDLRPERANIRIPREYVGSAANDIGFAWDQDSQSYRAIISEYDSGHDKVTRAGSPAWQNKVSQRASYHTVSKAAKRKGYRVKEVATNDGTVRLQLVSLR